MESAEAKPYGQAARLGQNCYRLDRFGDRHVCHLALIGATGWKGEAGSMRGGVRRIRTEVVGVEGSAVMFGRPESAGGFVGEGDGGLVVADAF